MPPSITEALHAADPLLVLAVVILVGLLFGGVARRLRAPSITGQILGGVLIGKGGLDLFGEAPLHALQPITHFALGLMAVTVGAHLNVRRLRNAGRRLSLLLLAEATVTPLIVFVVLVYFAGVEPGLGLLFATCAIATAPATIVALVKEARAKGVFVKTLVAAVALNNLACIFLFEVARALTEVQAEGGATLLAALAGPARQLVGALVIGGLAALAMELVARLVAHSDRVATAAIVSVVLTSGISDLFGISPLLSCLFLGLIQSNISHTGDRFIDAVFADFMPVILVVFFTLAGMHLSLEHAREAGLLALLLFGARLGGKILAADLAMRFAHATEGVRKNLGLALIPQAGVAVALVILVQDDPRLSALPGFAETFSAVVLTVVTINEIVGPIFARMSLKKCGEAGMDRTRLMDFIQEENIVTDFHAADQREAIEKLVDLMVRSQHLRPDERQPLLESVLEREREASTALGGGLAVPHGILPDDKSMVGVLAVSREGLPFPTPDGEPIHCMVLLGTPRAERDRHLQVLAALARTIGTDPVFRARLVNAKSAAHASELLHGEASQDFNYFLEED